MLPASAAYHRAKYDHRTLTVDHPRIPLLADGRLSYTRAGYIEFSKNGKSMDKKHEQELIRCAQNKSLTIRPDDTQSCERIARSLMQDGYLIPVASRRDPGFRPEVLSNVYGQVMTLTDQGKGYLLALSSEDFNTGELWPLADDIRHVQRRLSHASG